VQRLRASPRGRVGQKNAETAADITNVAVAELSAAKVAEKGCFVLFVIVNIIEIIVLGRVAEVAEVGVVLLKLADLLLLVVLVTVDAVRRCGRNKLMLETRRRRVLKVAAAVGRFRKARCPADRLAAGVAVAMWQRAAALRRKICGG
jgi:hypothetical protein